MEQSSKNQDCYFYYYSTCTKGDSCHFRHEPSALGIEVMCTYWQQGNCMNEHCNFRHMELKKNRKSIPCYWESQRGGCKKPHCPFLHTLDRPAPSEATINPSKTPGPKPVTQEWSNRPDGEKFAEASGESSVGHGSSESSSFISGSVVDPIIVRFNEETDNEGNTPSPQKSAQAPSPRPPLNFRRQKTYEEERIDEIVEETAAYYSYPVYKPMGEEYVPSRIVPKKLNTEEKCMDFEVLTLEEIKRRKKAIFETNSSDYDSLDNQVTLSVIGNEDLTPSDGILPTESRKRKIFEDQPSKPIKLKRSSAKNSTVGTEDQTVGKEDHKPGDAAKDIQLRLCDSTSDGKEENGKQEEVSLDDPLDDVGDTAEAVDDIMDDIHQLLGET
ncbi:zinc finger CCCH domain-containing protein 11A-like isoform X2 [Cotesia glomerata]|uniref:zinc finger CCCH domain-containing protein 11A-like isoform X2 n=1 Tax=Cotesia glomerata TaxID=32391 RepID=UPI001D01A14C|nr:zinc finger CCCH domain-containing protein 11A-like isoform X2 [Cotesia glomerata]